MPDDGVSEIPVFTETEEMNDFWKERLCADRDRHSTNATSLEHIIGMQYASSSQFRDANAARVVLESGSGRTRAETNNPANTAAPQG